MIRVGLVRLEGYESWIRSLGYDREWIVQAAQADVYRNLVIESAGAGMFSLPLTYDSYLVIINAAEVEGFKEVVSKLSDKAPVVLAAYVGLGRSYSEAVERLRPLSEACEDPGEGALEDTVVVHLDLDGYNELMSNKGLHYVEELMNAALHRARKISTKHGGLAYYAGGDNIICFVPCERLSDFLDEVRVGDFKVGVGIAPRPRDALALAAQALDAIRLERQSDKVLVMRDPEREPYARSVEASRERLSPPRGTLRGTRPSPKSCL